MVSQRRKNQPRRKQIVNRKHRRHVRFNAPIINNDDTLRQIANLPQQSVDDQSIFQFFNGFSFY